MVRIKIILRGDFVLGIILAIENDDDRAIVLDLYIRYEKRIFKVACKYLNNISYAEDCVHDVFCAIIEHFDKFKLFDEIHKIKYMSVSCRNAAINKYNNKSKHTSTTTETEDLEDRKTADIEDEAADVIDIVINEELKRKLREYIDAIDTKYRDVLILRYEYGFKTKEIASALYISDDLVRQRLRRAKELLKRTGGKELYALFRK